MTRSLRRPAATLALLLAATGAAAVEFWAAPAGRPGAAGTAADPLPLIDAQRRAREWRRLAPAPLTEPVRIVLRGGTYPLDAAWTVRPEDSGTAASPTVFAAAPGEAPVLSGGVAVAGWTRPTAPVPGLPGIAQGEIWVAPAPLVGGRPREFRQLWIDGRKAIRARTPNGGEMDRLVAWTPADETAVIPARPELPAEAGTLEMVIYQQWEIALLRVRELAPVPGGRRVRFHQPESRVQFEHPWPAPIMTATYRAPFFLQNSPSLLDTPGEWHHDQARGLIYYWPRPGEQLAGAAAIVPVQESLLEVVGTLDRPVVHVRFEGLRFAHAAWLRPGLAGHVPHQAGFYMTEAYKMLPPGTPDKRSLENQAWVGRPPGAVTLRAVQDLRFERCRFEHLASAGLDADHGIRRLTVEGCIFRDIGGNGVQLGTFADGPVETHVPYAPADDREICADNRLANNVVTDCANEDWGCLGLAVGSVRTTVIEHNDISNLPYSGISLGWGWTRTIAAQRANRVRANRITGVCRILYDNAGIYLLAAQPGTEVVENAIGAIVPGPYTEKPHWGYIYLDEGSSFTVVRDNWSPTEKTVRNANGPGNVWERNGPEVADAIREAAGLQEPFRDLAGEPDRRPPQSR